MFLQSYSKRKKLLPKNVRPENKNSRPQFMQITLICIVIVLRKRDASRARAKLFKNSSHIWRQSKNEREGGVIQLFNDKS